METNSEGTVMSAIVTQIAGKSNIPSEGHLPFVSLESITTETTVKPVPDFFDGAPSTAIHQHVRQDLDKIIVPTKHTNAPVAPNFFLEAKNVQGSSSVMKRQVVLDGAYGARIMHSLQNYLEKEPVYNINAYAFTSTLIDGHLRLFAHHLTPPAGDSQRPEHHITSLKSYSFLWSMTVRLG